MGWDFSIGVVVGGCIGLLISSLVSAGRDNLTKNEEVEE